MHRNDPAYRYLLWRSWSAQPASICAFIALNPSTADAIHDDPTSRRCIGYARRWGYDALVLVNLFAYRSVQPSALRASVDPVGRYNDAVIDSVAAGAALIVCAWGNHGRWQDRAMDVASRLRNAGRVLHALGTTRSGEPLHPLYQRGDRLPIVWRGAAVATTGLE